MKEDFEARQTTKLVARGRGQRSRTHVFACKDYILKAVRERQVVIISGSSDHPPPSNSLTRP